jgi:hypothetical protein
LVWWHWDLNSGLHASKEMPPVPDLPLKITTKQLFLTTVRNTKLNSPRPCTLTTHFCSLPKGNTSTGRQSSVHMAQWVV